MRVRPVQETKSEGQSFVVACDGVAESPSRRYATCDYAGTPVEVVLLGETEGFARRTGAELWLKTREENLAGALEPTLDAFTGDMNVVGQESTDGVDSYIVESGVDLGKFLSSSPHVLQLVNVAESGSPIGDTVAAPEARRRKGMGMAYTSFCVWRSPREHSV
jgi:hypothetical protein